MGLEGLTRSALRFSWAMSLYAPTQTWRLLAAPFHRADERKAADAFEAVAWKTGRQLPGGWNQAFLAGDSLQRDLTGLGLSALPTDPLDPAAWTARTGALLAASGEALRFFVPDRDGCLAWQELLNKVEVFRLVQQVAEKIGVPGPGQPFDLPALVGRAYALEPYEALWAVEGLGHDYTDHHWPPRHPPPRDLLTAEAAATVPAKSLLMLHAGIGLAVAERRIAPLEPDVEPSVLDPVVEEILAIDRDNSLPGDLGAAWESLGLYTRSFHPRLLAAVDASLRRVAPEALGYYWHGVGRAFYFLPVNFLPCGRLSWRPFEMARAAAPGGEEHRNTFAGLAWATSLVNMRQPEILARLLIRPHGRELAADDGFANGVASALMMRWDTTPGAPLVERFLAYRPEAGDPELTRLWDELIVRPATTALESWYPVLKRRRRLGEIFRYQDLAALVAELR